MKNYSLTESILFLISISLLLSCNSENKEQSFTLPENAVKILAGNGSKTWKLAKRTNNNTRVNMGDCTLAYRQTFFNNYTVRDNNSEGIDCGKSIEGSWDFATGGDGNTYLKITSDLIPEIFKVKRGSNSKFFQIVHLSDSFLVYRFNHELFDSKTTIIEDVLVHEPVEVNDRDFHGKHIF